MIIQLVPHQNVLHRLCSNTAMCNQCCKVLMKAGLFALLMQQRCMSTVIGTYIPGNCQHTCKCDMLFWSQMANGGHATAHGAVHRSSNNTYQGYGPDYCQHYVSVTCCCVEIAIVSHATAHRDLHRCSINNHQGYGH